MSLVNEILEGLSNPDEVAFNLEVRDSFVSDEFRGSFPIGRSVTLFTILVCIRGLTAYRSIRDILPTVCKTLQLTYPKLIPDPLILRSSILFRKNIIDCVILAELLALVENNPEEDKQFKLSENGKKFLTSEISKSNEIGVLIRKLLHNRKLAKATVDI